jgi:xylulokinase
MVNEPAVFDRVHKAMLPGDYIAMRMTDEIMTTISGLSEAILWDYGSGDVARIVLEAMEIPEDVIPPAVPAFSEQGELTPRAAAELGLKPGIPISYRAGDQPNNALSLRVLQPGEVAATAGTSGVVYGIAADPVFDSASRVNTFVHVNHASDAPRFGVLLCVNGTGIQNSWVRNDLLGGEDGGMSYDRMNALAATAPAGAEGLIVIPFGNGAERTLSNRDIGASIHGLNFIRHGREHVLRAVQEGIVFALNHGLQIMAGMGMSVRTVRAGRANMFLSPLFRSAFATVTGATVELFNTDGAQGAARGAGIGAGIFGSEKDAFRGLDADDVIEPVPAEAAAYGDAYSRWVEILQSLTAV